MKRDLNTLKLIVAETLSDNLSNCCNVEVNECVIENIAHAIFSNGEVWSTANDLLSNMATNELEDSNSFDYFNSLK